MQLELDQSWSWKSRISSANEPGCGFPLQNLPYCAFQADDTNPHLGVGIGRFILDIHETAKAGLLDTLPANVRISSMDPNLNALMECGVEVNAQLRHRLLYLLKEDGAEFPSEVLARLLLPMKTAVFRRPVAVGNYTDFYASIHHATNVGRLFRPDQPLLPNYKFMPIGYHGRASSLVLSGTPIVRPKGQSRTSSAETPTYGPTGQLDFELEVGAYIGSGNALGQPIDISEAEQHLFGLSLVNDWSARDIQAWEYQPLGPFLGKSFATTISPWVVTMDSLAPFRVPLEQHSEEDPKAQPYLTSSDTAAAAIDLSLEVYLSTTVMRESSIPPFRLSAVNLQQLYWSFAQMITHHTSNGCNLLPGDLIASGTVSGSEEGTQGSLLEITCRGATPMHLPSGELRTFLEDGDEIVLRGFCEREGLPRISFGECSGTITHALV